MISLPVYFQKITIKILNPLHEIKLLMFSKENSSEDISFTQPIQTEVTAMVSRFKKEN